MHLSKCIYYNRSTKGPKGEVHWESRGVAEPPQCGLCLHALEAAAKGIVMRADEDCCEPCGRLKDNMPYMPFPLVCTMYQKAEGAMKDQLDYMRAHNSVAPSVTPQVAAHVGRCGFLSCTMRGIGWSVRASVELHLPRH